MLTVPSESEFVRHTACEACGSSDANAEYSDGHFFCFSCGQLTAALSDLNQWGELDDMTAPAMPCDVLQFPGDLLTVGVIDALPDRRITRETALKFGYKVDGDSHIAPYHDASGTEVAQKVRSPRKEFRWVGKPKRAELFGQRLWSGGGRRIIVTEGEEGGSLFVLVEGEVKE